MLENKKRAKSFKDLALVPACVRWRLSEKIKNITAISNSYGGGGGN